MSRAMRGMAAQPQPQRLADRTVQAERLFYVIAGTMMLILAAVGFRSFILHGKGFGGDEITRQIVPLVVAHGLAMFSWVSFFLVQGILILTGNRRVHMVVGPAGAVLAAVIVVLGSATAASSVHFGAPLYQPFGGARFFLAIMLGEILSFGALVAIGIVYRRRIEIHRPMMLLATVMITSGSLARFPYTSELAVVPPLYVLGPTLLVGALLFLLQWGMSRVASRFYAIGYAGMVIAGLASVVVGRSALWSQIAGKIVP